MKIENIVEAAEREEGEESWQTIEVEMNEEEKKLLAEEGLRYVLLCHAYADKELSYNKIYELVKKEFGEPFSVEVPA